MKIALATYEGLPNLTQQEYALIPLFVQSGIEAEAVVWSDENIDWRIYDAVIIRSCWDYHKRIDEFLTWLDELDRLKVKCWNATDIIRQNSRKTYLRDLAAQGANVIPTEWLTREHISDIPAIMKRSAWEKAVIKPIVSATAYKTFMISGDHLDEQLPQINEIFTDGETFMLQQFMPQIYAHGEWSLIFLNKEFSHAVLKTAKSGEFRVQADFGGSSQILEAPRELILQAKDVLSYYKEPLLYARVDGIWIEGKFYLMELELTEPELFLNDQHKRERFIQAFLYICQQNQI